ncbi:N-6 DNA methylase [Spirosoma rigui]|uniref:N-6 DNA methylase n=1 Tax=Spirosoma rigui TaxID=564064 RepID=UPI0009AF8A63|nr:N-6 DNA methylase [Spirosoma rigui]
MRTTRVERDTEILIDNQLKNLGWINNPNSADRNVYQQRVKTEEQRVKLQGKRPDYTLYSAGSNSPLAIIEAKKPGRSIHDALSQGLQYAHLLDAPIVFATDGVFTKAIHTQTRKPLLLNGEEVDEFLKEALAIQYILSNEVSTLDKKVIKSRSELITIFETANNLLREEGLQQGLDRFTEFANILFLKVLSEVEDAKEEAGEKSKIAREYRWNYFKKKSGNELISYVSDTVLKWFSLEYKDDSLFKGLNISHPENLKEIIKSLDDLQLTDINADIKGDAFEYFIRSYSASNPSDLGEIFTPRHVVKTTVKLVNPQIGETIYDPFCGTGGMLIVAYKHIMDSMARTASNIKQLKENTLWGSELTKTASIAKMNMILAGDGHSNVVKQDTLANPVDGKFDVVITNYPFSQKTRYGESYLIPSRNADLICPQHCIRALKDGGRMAMIAPEGFLTNKNSSAYEDVRKYLLENAKLQNVISLPRGSFEPYNRAKASILYFTDVRKAKTKGHYWYFNIKNDGYTLDKKRRKIEGVSDLELVLSETDLDNQSQPYLHALGITKIEIADIKENEYVLSAAPYIKLPEITNPNYTVYSLGELIEPASNGAIGLEKEVPIMSITMENGLIDQGDKFKKRIASLDIAKYNKVMRNDLVVGFPIDEGVLGFQTKYNYAAVSPAYNIWKLKGDKVDVTFLEILLRSHRMREIYKSLMQGSVDRRRSIPDDIFLKIKIPVPSSEIREQIKADFQSVDEHKKQIKTLEKKIQSEVNNLFD